MAGLGPALGRPVGSVDTDTGGAARYSLKLDVPPGIGIGNEPVLTLQYAQGGPNGSVGSGWALGGLSCIRKQPGQLSYDGVNSPLMYDDPAGLKLALDGTELLNVKGTYGAQDAVYTTEINNEGVTVTPLGRGFEVVDSNGRRRLYGTSDDSIVLVSATATPWIREWRLKKQIDHHGNAITYSYVATPHVGPGSPDLNACYLSSIRYTSNENTGHPGSRLVKLEYSARPDVVVQTVQGDKAVWAHLLTSIRFGIISGPDTQYSRGYKIEYAMSPDTNESQLVSINETSAGSSTHVNLLPSTFGYTKPEVNAGQLYKVSPKRIYNLRSSLYNVAIFTMNISGRGLADIACVRHDRRNQQLSVKTYLMTRGQDGSIDWIPSHGPGCEANLPLIDTSDGFPSIMVPDISGDGRSDLIVPYRDSAGMTAFSISQSTGTGFSKCRIEKTSSLWVDNSRFMAIDLGGRGSIDIVQMFNHRGKLALRDYGGSQRNGVFGLRAPVITKTSYDFDGTIDWFQLGSTDTGSCGLVRIWSQSLHTGRVQMKATAFHVTFDKEGYSIGFKEGKTSLLGEPARLKGLKIHVLPTDINGDGVQDVVLATADYASERLTLMYTTYLGDGHGGFTKTGNTMVRHMTAPAPLKRPDHGDFHLTNTNGSNYPTLSYLYQQQKPAAYACVSVDGKCDGSVTEPNLQQLTTNLPCNQLQIVPTDVDGNGMGDWLFYTVENDQPKLEPYFNQSKPTGLLSWAQDPMGLRTDVTYGTLAQPEVYRSSVEWNRYSNESQDNYPVLGGPNYVVTGLNHCNIDSINALPYRVSIKKTYESARINTRGRGWQGFSKINTLNTTVGVLTTETYLQDWPLTGSKSLIETKTPNGQVLKSEIASYEAISDDQGRWKTYRLNKIEDRIDMWDGNSVGRSNRTSYVYDKHGNVVLKSLLETQNGQLTHESWECCSYTTINNITNLMTGKKLSFRPPNRNFPYFFEGDLSLSTFQYDEKTAKLTTASEWSSSHEAFASRKLCFDPYGNEIYSLDVSGLETRTTFDTKFNSYPIKVEMKGPTTSATIMFAYDEASGQKVAEYGMDGSVRCCRLDEFGRNIATRVKASQQPSEFAISGSNVLGGRSFVADDRFADLLKTTVFEPCRELTYKCMQIGRGLQILGTTSIDHSKAGINGQTETTQVLDCVQKTRKQITRQGGDNHCVLRTWEYDVRGEKLFVTYPCKVALSFDFSATLDSSLGIRYTYDILGRLAKRTRPTHAARGQLIVSTISYLNGGSTIQESVTVGNEPSFGEKVQSLVTKRCARVAGEDRVIERIDECGLKTTYYYDAHGKLVESCDAARNVELRTYDSTGNLLSFNNPHQRTSTAREKVAVQYQYNLAKQLIEETNSLGQSIVYTRDEVGRMIQKLGDDGRITVYEYDHGGTSSPSNITTYPSGLASPPESRVQFKYDHLNRLTEQVVTLTNDQSYFTSFSYDWQDRVVRKVLPGGASLEYDYQGSLLRCSALSIGSSSSLVSTISRYSALAKPEKVILEGSALAASVEHKWTYDIPGFPSSHSLLKNGGVLAQAEYVYNDLDQLITTRDPLANSSIDYGYTGRRLASSSPSDGSTNVYAYDAAGNLTQNRGTSIAHTSGRAIGTNSDKIVFDVSYDGAGRMTRRVADNASTAFTYSSHGFMSRHERETDVRWTNIISDHQGETLQQTHSDGTSDIFVSPECSIHTNVDGTSVVRHKLFNDGALLATITSVYQRSVPSKLVKTDAQSVSLAFTNTKGTVTETFDGQSLLRRNKFLYDDYGLLQNDEVLKVPNGDSTSLYEGKKLDSAVCLYDYRSRWYDPLIGRFTTPDNILDPGLLMQTDGMNRYAFENNDPINHIDPDGHWGFDSIFGLSTSVLLVTVGVALTVATGGAAGVVIAAVAGAAIAGGVSGIVYSIQNHDEEDGNKFWGGFGATVGANAAIGAAAGGLGATATIFKAAGPFARIGLAALKGATIGGTAALASQLATRSIDNAIYDKHQDIWQGWEETVAFGVIAGAGSGGYRAAKAGKPLSGVLSRTLKTSAKPLLSLSNKLGFTEDAENLIKKASDSNSSYAQLANQEVV